MAGPCLIDELLGPMPTTNVVSEAASALNNTLGFASGSSEAPVQDAMVSVFQSMHDTQQQQRQPAMLVWDSHAHGLAISGSSSRAKPDLLLCDTFEAPANIVTVVEAKPSLNNSSHAKEAAFQVNQRVQQLRSVQSRRVSWVLAAVGAKAVDIWHMTTQEGQVCHRQCYYTKRTVSFSQDLMLTWSLCRQLFVRVQGHCLWMPTKIHLGYKL